MGSKRHTKAKAAVIYCRVSSAKQVSDGHGNQSQETRCREFASHKGYDVVRTFYEDGVSGSVTKRPAMQTLLAYLKRRKTPTVVLIDDVSRLARGLQAHLELRTAISDAGGILESPSIEFGSDSDSLLVENLLASVSQHQRQKNAEQVVNRMRARVLNGYYISNPPTGYVYKKTQEHGKLLVRDEPTATHVQNALEMFASGRLQTQVEVKRYLESIPEFPRSTNGEVKYDTIRGLLTRVLYAGYISLPKWGIHLQPAKHEPLISYDTFQRVQERLESKARAPARVDVRDEFVLRNLVSCGCCGRDLTAGMANGRAKKYAYYWCPSKRCSQYGKSIKRDDMNRQFEARLSELTLSPQLASLARDMFKDLWEVRREEHQRDDKALELERNDVDRQIQKLVNRVIQTDSPALIQAYENSIQELEEKKVTLSDAMRNRKEALPTFEEAYDDAFRLLSNPRLLWDRGDISQRRTMVRLLFTENLKYKKQEGFEPLDSLPIALPMRVMRDFAGNNSKMVEDLCIERRTFNQKLNSYGINLQDYKWFG